MKPIKLAFASTANVENPSEWSGTLYNMHQALKEQCETVYLLDKIKRTLPASLKFTQFYRKIFGLPRTHNFAQIVAKSYSNNLQTLLEQTNVDAIISPFINPVAWLECKQPIVLWMDAAYGSMVGFYHQSKYISGEIIDDYNAITRASLERCSLAIFSSDWAAESAISLYGTPREKVKVVPYGANLSHSYNTTDIQKIISQRDMQTIKLLFIGKDWKRKGGDKVIQIADALIKLGRSVELHIVGGNEPSSLKNLPYLKLHGFVSKETLAGREKIKNLLKECHFFIMPSIAEAYGIVFCEANAFGLPALASYVGGIPTIIKDDVNGKTFSLQTDASIYANYIDQLMQNPEHYYALALSSFHEYQKRLNWKSAATTVCQLIAEII